MRRITHKDEYFARLWYEENRNSRSPRIWVVSQIPTPFVWEDGTVDYCTVTSNQYTVMRHKYTGNPRWCEWGADISEVKVEVSTFYRRELCWCKPYPQFTYKFPVYVQGSGGSDAQKKAETIASHMLLRFYRK